MALGKCKECGKEISDQAVSCPNCGAPLPGLSDEKMEDIKKHSTFAKSRWLGGMAFLGGLAWLFFSAQIGGKDAFVMAWGGAKWFIGIGAIWYIVAEIERNLHNRKK